MHKTFAESLEDLVNEYSLFLGNPDAVSDEIISALANALLQSVDKRAKAKNIPPQKAHYEMFCELMGLRKRS